MLQSHYVVSKRSHDMSTSQGGRAIAEQAGHLTSNKIPSIYATKGEGKEQTFHLFCFVIRRVMDRTQELCTNRKTLILGQSIQFLEGSLYFVLPQQQLDVFLCDTLSISSVSVTARLLNRPCLICLVARARTESSTTNILMIISATDNIAVGGILV